MNVLYRRFNQIDTRTTEWMARNGIMLLRSSLGVVYFWFGFLKFFPGLSPAQDLATRTISTLSFGLIPASVSIVLLATWESLIGLGLVIGKQLRVILLLLFLQMVGTVLPRSSRCSPMRLPWKGSTSSRTSCWRARPSPSARPCAAGLLSPTREALRPPRRSWKRVLSLYPEGAHAEISAHSINPLMRGSTCRSISSSSRGVGTSRSRNHCSSWARLAPGASVTSGPSVSSSIRASSA